MPRLTHRLWYLVYLVCLTVLFAAKKGFAVTPLEIAYGPGERNKLDLYLPAAKKARLVVYVHGGAWISGSKESYHFLGKAFSDAGFAVAIPNYRLSGGETAVQFPEHAADIAQAIHFLSENGPRWKFDRKQIFVIGHSAGAHIAATLAFSPAFADTARLIRGSVGLEGIYNVPALVLHWPTYREWFVNAAFGSDDSKWKEASPQLWKVSPPHPWLLIHSGKDELVERQQTEDFYNHLKEAGVPVKLDQTSQQSHFGVVQALEGAGNPQMKTILNFLRE